MEPDNNLDDIKLASMLIDKLKNSTSLHKMNENVNEELNNRLNLFSKNKISLMMIGETSSGKTTLMNSIISYVVENSSFKKDFLRFLPSDKKENTTYLWIVESSEDSHFHLIVDNQNITVYAKKTWEENLKDIKEDIQKLNDEQKNEIDNMKANCSEYYQKVILIKIPNFDNSLRLIDVAGLASSKTIERLKNLVNREMACLFYIKDIENSEDVKENIIKFISQFQEQDENKDDLTPPSIFSIIFTKKDLYFNITENELEDCYDISEDAIKVSKIAETKTNDFIKMIERTKNAFKKGKTIKIYDLFSLNLHKLCLPMKNDPKYIKTYNEELAIYKRFYLSLNPLKEFTKIIRPFRFYSSLEEYIDDLVNKQNEQKIISTTILRKAQNKSTELLEEFEKNLNDFFFHFQNLDTLKNYEQDIYSGIENLIIQKIKEEKETVSGFGVMNRNHFIEKVLSLIQEEVLTMIIAKIRIMYLKVHSKFTNFIIDEIGDENYGEIFNIRLDPDRINSDGLGLDNGDRALLSLLLSGSLYAVGVWSLQRVAVGLGVMATEALIPGIGWAAFGLTAASAVWGLKNYLGLFDRENCKKDIFERVCTVLYERKTMVKNQNKELSSKDFEEIIEKLRKSKKRNEEIKILKNEIYKLKSKYMVNLRLDLLKNEIIGLKYLDKN